MRVLLLPVNVASHLSVTARGLATNGVEARGLVGRGASPLHSNDGVHVASYAGTRRSPRWWLDITRSLPRLAGEIRRADVLHWFMSPMLPGALDLRFAARFGKPGLIEFAGGDIRVPQIEADDNEYYARRGPGYEYIGWESERRSQHTQRQFSSARQAALISCWSLLPYLDPVYYPTAFIVRQRVMTADFEPAYPDPTSRRPVVVHAASAPIAKGTSFVLEAIERLRGDVDFEFILLDRVPHAEALAAVARADVFLDQFILGAHGGAAVEAMALGKPVVGYVKPSLAPHYPPDLPLVQAEPKRLADVLGKLLRDGPRRYRLGVESRGYAERHHDAAALGLQLVSIYERLLGGPSLDTGGLEIAVPSGVPVAGTPLAQQGEDGGVHDQPDEG